MTIAAPKHGDVVAIEIEGRTFTALYIDMTLEDAKTLEAETGEYVAAHRTSKAMEIDTLHFKCGLVAPLVKPVKVGTGMRLSFVNIRQVQRPKGPEGTST